MYVSFFIKNDLLKDNNLSVTKLHMPKVRMSIICPATPTKSLNNLHLKKSLKIMHIYMQ